MTDSFEDERHKQGAARAPEGSSEEAYAGYLEAKGWHERITEAEHVYADEMYRKETRGVHIGAGTRLLEIGFGKGLFLDWAASRGASVVGVELLEELCSLASKRHANVCCGELLDLAAKGKLQGPFDVVAMWDVLEHLDRGQAAQYLATIRALMRDGAHLILRFPNAQSPLSAQYQHGDPTHRAAYSAATAAALAKGHGFSVRRTGNAARVYGNSLAKRLARVPLFLARDLLETTIGLVYFERRIPLDPNVTVLLEAGDWPSRRRV